MKTIKTAEEFLKDNNVYEETIVFKNNERTIKVSKLLEEYANLFKYDYSKSCECGSERIGETWCCNQCGLPTNRYSNKLSVSLLKLALNELSGEPNEENVGNAILSIEDALKQLVG